MTEVSLWQLGEARLLNLDNLPPYGPQSYCLTTEILLCQVTVEIISFSFPIGEMNKFINSH
jgi:hypothetical protein